MRVTRTARLLASVGAATLLLGLSVDGTAQAAPATTVDTDGRRPTMTLREPGTRCWLQVLAATCTVGLAVGLVAGPAAAVPVTTVDTVTYSSPSFALSGLEMGSQTVSAHVVSPLPGWEFVLTSSGGTGTVRRISVLAQRSAGTDSDGTWTATVQLPSTADGTWSLSTVYDCEPMGIPDVCDGGTPTPVTGAATFAVAGTHQPRVSWSQSPRPLVYPQVAGTITGRVVDADTGMGMPGLSVGYCADVDMAQRCAGGAFDLVRKTTATGAFQFRPAHLADRFQWLSLGTLSANSDLQVVGTWREMFVGAYRPTLTAAPKASRARVGSSVLVPGLYYDAAGIYGGLRSLTVQLQQLHGRSQWRTLWVARVRRDAEGLRQINPFTGAVRPTAKGANVFRVLFAGDTDNGVNLIASSAKPFTITGT